MDPHVSDSKRTRIIRTAFVATIIVALFAVLTARKLALKRQSVGVRAHVDILAARNMPAGIPLEGDLPLPVKTSPEQVVAAQRKRVLGRATSLFELDQVVSKDVPIIQDALASPANRSNLNLLARLQHVSASEMEQQWVRLQAADLMLESGGNPDAISPAGAAGVAQWMPGPGIRAGLSVDITESRSLTEQITLIGKQIDSLAAANASVASGAPSNPQVNAQIEQLSSAITALRARRESVDERFNPRKAIFAQTRYLMGLVKKFPSPSWIFQAYHGGEAGVSRTIRFWRGQNRSDVAAAIKSGDNGAPLTFEQVYFSSTPQSHSEAFSYLYGRGDDHRHYWWKLRTAQEGMDEYRADKAKFEKDCTALFPGQPPPAIWYGTDHRVLRNLEDVQDSIRLHELVTVSSNADLSVIPTPDATIDKEAYQSLRPWSKGALLLVASKYRKLGGMSKLVVPELTRTEELNRLMHLNQSASPSAPASNSIGDDGPIDYRTIGVQFDIQKPENPLDKKILDYTIGLLEDRSIVLRMSPQNRHVWQLVPNPQYGKALEQISITGIVPDFGLQEPGH